MTITLFSGTPGSGKSLHMAQMIYWRTRRKRFCIANFEVNKELINERYFKDVGNDLLSPEVLQNIATDYFSRNKKGVEEGSITLFIDECQLIFNARTWNDKDRKEWIRFFTQHRKLGFEIYLIAQFDYMIDKQIRSLIEYETKHRKLNNYGLFGRIAGLIVLKKPITVAVTYWYQMKQRLSSQTFVGRRKYYQMYDTMKIFGG